MLIRFIATVFSILMLLAAAASAEHRSEQQEGLAERHQREGDLQTALEMYQSLLAQNPESGELADRIQGIYRELKRYPELIAFLNHRLEKKPGDFDLHLALGEAYFLSGQVQMAKEGWLRALALAPKAEEPYFQVGKAFWERGMLGEAEDVFQRGRVALEDETLFAETLARLYEVGADYQAATREYLIWLSQDARRLSYVNSRIAQFPRDESTAGVVEEALTVAVTTQPDRLEFGSLLGHHLIRAGKAEQAYHQFLMVDQQSKESKGKVLLNFANRCAELGHYDIAIKACQEVAARYPDQVTAHQAQLIVGHNLATMERYGDALDAYEGLIRMHPESSEAAEAMYARGEIYFLHMDDVESALRVFRILKAGAGTGFRTAQATFRVGDCLVVKGDLHGARGEYQSMVDAHQSDEVREKAAYKLAELLLLEGQFQQSKEAFDQLVVSFPQGFYVNDALIQSIFLDDAISEQEGPLQTYIGAMRLGVQRQYEQALSAYQKTLQQHPGSILADDILMQMASLKEKIGQHQEALAELNALLKDYPESRLCPQAQRRIGEIFELQLDDVNAALEAYQKVLSKYPRYLFLDDVRRKIRQLKGEAAS